MEPWVKITKSGENYIYMTGYGCESDGRVELGDTGCEADFNEVMKKSKEFLVKKLWRSSK